GPKASLDFYANQNWSSGANGTYGIISTTPNGSTTLTSVLKFENDGGIDTPNAVGGDKGPGTINLNGVFSTNVSSTGYAGFFSGTGTGASYGVYSSMTGAANTGYAGYFSNTSSGGWSVYGSGIASFNTADIRPQPLTISANAVATDISTGNYFYVTLSHTATTTVSSPTNPRDGAALWYEFTQDATGSNLVSWGTAFDFGTAGTPTLTTTANKIDLVGFRYSARNSKW